MSPMITIGPAITLNIVKGRHNDRAIENIVTDFVANALPVAQGGIVILFSFKGSNLCFCQHFASLSDVLFKGGQPLFEGFQIMAEPHASDTRSGDKNTALA